MNENEVGGLVDIREVSISNIDKSTTYDLKDIFLSFNIYEDLFLPFKSGRLILRDTNDLQSFLPIIGGEEIEISYKSKNDKNLKRYKFYVYKLQPDNEITSTDKNARRLILFFTSDEQLKDIKPLCKAFTGKAESTVSTLLTTYLKSNKPLDADTTNDPIEFVANFWRPSKIIKFLSRSTTQGSKSDFVFYEDKDGFKFKSVANLMAEGPSHEVEFVDDLESQWNMNKFQRFTISKYFDLLTMAKNGSLGNTVFQFDNEKYKFSKEEEDFETVTEFGTSLGQNVQIHSDFLNDNVITTYKDSRYVAKRDQLLKALDKYHILIQLTGDSTKTVGQVFNVIIRDRVRDSKEQNQLLSGNSLVLNVNHEVHNDGLYLQNIKLVKNAFFKLDKTSKVKGKRNV